MRDLVFRGDSCCIEEVALPIPRGCELLLRVQAVILPMEEIMYKSPSESSTPRYDSLQGERANSSKSSPIGLIPGRIVLGTVIAGADGEEIEKREVFALVGDAGGGAAEFVVAHPAFIFPRKPFATNAHEVRYVLQHLNSLLAHYATFFQTNISQDDTVAVFGADSVFGANLVRLMRNNKMDIVTFPSHFTGAEHEVFCRAQIALELRGTTRFIPSILPHLAPQHARIVCLRTPTTSSSTRERESKEEELVFVSELWRKQISLHFVHINQQLMTERTRRELRSHFEAHYKKERDDGVEPESKEEGEEDFLLECALDAEDLSNAFQLIDHHAQVSSASSPPSSTLLCHISASSSASYMLSKELHMLMNARKKTSQVNLTHNSPPRRHAARVIREYDDDEDVRSVTVYK